MVGPTLLALLLAWTQGNPPATKDGTKPAMEREKFPWYDSKSDAPRPVWPSEESQLPRAFGRRGHLSGARVVAGSIVMTLMTIAIAAALAGILWAFYRFAPLPNGAARLASPVTSRSATIEALPSDLPSTLDDPWAEAARLRDAGKLAEAIIALYVHQLLSLNERGLIRLAPGKTGRQLVRSIADPWIRDRVQPTLRLFESSFYGHHEPSPEDFEVAWKAAGALEARMSGGVVA